MGCSPYRHDGDHGKLASGDVCRIGGSGGLVAVGRDGGLALPFNCTGMHRGYVKGDGIVYTAIYNEAYRSA